MRHSLSCLHQRFALWLGFVGPTRVLEVPLKHVPRSQLSFYLLIMAVVFLFANLNSCSEEDDTGTGRGPRQANAWLASGGSHKYHPQLRAAMYLPTEKISAPLIGENAVFVISVTNREEAATADLSGAEMRLKYALESRSNFEAYNALLEDANIQDYRLDIFYN